MGGYFESKDGIKAGVYPSRAPDRTEVTICLVYLREILSPTPKGPRPAGVDQVDLSRIGSPIFEHLGIH